MVGHPLLLCWNVITTFPPTTETRTSEIFTVSEHVAEVLAEDAETDVLADDAADELLADEAAADVLTATDELLAVPDGDVDVCPLPAQATAMPAVEKAAAIAPTATVVATLRLSTIV